MKKTVFLIGFFLFVIGSIFFYKNFYLFVAKYENFKFNLTKSKIIANNNKVEKNLEKEIYKFNNVIYNYKEYSLEKFGVKFSDLIDEKPIGYFDVYKNRIIFIAFDGTIYSTNNIEDIKKDSFSITKISNPDPRLQIDPEDENSYRNIKIRDILIHKDNIFVVSNRSKIKNDKYYGSIEVLKGIISIEKKQIKFDSFFSTNEEYPEPGAHSGGRLIHLEDENYLLSSADFHLINEYPLLVDKVSSNNSIIGKTLLLNGKNFKVFSKGHRNIQGLFYDRKNQIIFSSEHGPSGGDEINLIMEGKNYGWPKSSYGSIGYEFPNHPRKHKKYGFEEPLYYWWPFNCAPSELIIVNKDFNFEWKDSILASCLSGNHLNGNSLIRFVYDEKQKKLRRKEQFYIGDRIRDLKYIEDNNILVMLLENKKSLVFIFK